MGNDNSKQQIQATIRMQEHTESWLVDPESSFLLVDRSAGIMSFKSDAWVYYELWYSMTPICTQ